MQTNGRTEIAKREAPPPAPQTPEEMSRSVERVLIDGDLSRLTPEQRTHYYLRVCDSLGLNPLTKPFQYLELNRKLVLYALRDCTDQLRRLRGVSIEIVGKTLNNDGTLLTVHVRARDKDGRQDEDYGVVPLVAKQGDAAANQILKCVTKAKRRVTLSICGLGWLDETEVETIPGAVKIDTPAPSATPPAVARCIIDSVTPPMPERLSAAEAKRQKKGAVKDFNMLSARIQKARDFKTCVALWNDNGEMLATMPRMWFDTVAGEFDTALAKFGVDVDFDEHGWPIMHERDCTTRAAPLDLLDKTPCDCRFNPEWQDKSEAA
jgi:hypothetical protein